MALHDAALSILQFDDRTAVGLSVPGGSDPAARLGTIRFELEGGLVALSAPAPLPDGPCYSIIPRHDVTLRILTLPSQDNAEIAAMVKLGAAELVPYPIEEMLVAHHALAHLPNGESRVLVVLVRHATINSHVDALAGIGREPAQIFLSTACLVASAASLDPEGDVALLHVDPAALELVAVRGGELLFSRGVVQGAPWNLNDDQGRDTLACEVRDLLAAYRRERDDGQGADRIYISAMGLDPGVVAALLAEATGKECPVADTATIPLHDGGPCPATLAGAVLLAQGDGPLDLPLAPPGLARQRAMKKFQSQMLQGLALAGIVLLALLAWFGQAVWQRQHLIAELQEQIDAVAPDAQGVAVKQHSLQIISRQVEKGGSFLEILAGLAEAAPPSGLNIARIQFDRETGLNLWGRALSKDLVLKEFLGGLRNRAEGNLALFSAAHSLYETDGTERNQAVVNYQITVPVPEEDGDANAERDR